MQTNDTNIRGYFPQPDPNLPPRQQTAPFTPLQPTSPIVMRSEQSAPIAQRAAAVWQLLDKSMLMLLIAAVLGVAYALFVTISFWWFLRLLPHIVVTWAAVALTVAAMLTRDRPFDAGRRGRLPCRRPPFSQLLLPPDTLPPAQRLRAVPDDDGSVTGSPGSQRVWPAMLQAVTT